MSFILGLTGGIATGKSTVSKIFAEHHIPIVDADIAARAILEPGTKALAKVKEIFGEEILLDSGALNRKKLGDIVFNDQNKLDQLNECLSHYIRQWILTEKARLVEADHPLIVLDIPLLFEANYKEITDAVMVVAVDESTQLTRLIQRNQLSEEEARQRMNAQMDLSEKIKQADFVIYNNGTIEQLRARVEEWLISKGYSGD
ncbi:dephospho-CoA kinase [Marinilactibacillus kalidii]|uniref:dephospho-CoA kinase n=1 Tax=Marinilactibacillus kalidii TaxID=2820274 RepID=UPI001ABDFDEC|nr:dephospho-CoA kinase [Marinilactibacillus kalidii]